jgi:putative ABC transport system permease protein
LIVFSAVLATPLAWYLNNQLLQNFAYRVEMGIGVFVIGIAVTLVLAIVTIASHAVKAALANPVKALRYE